MTKPVLWLGFIFFLFNSTILNAAPSKKFTFSFEGGVFSSEIEDRIWASNTFQSTTAITTGFFRMRPSFRLGKILDFDPALGFTVPWLSSYDGAQKILPIQWNLDIGFNFTSWLKLRTGVGGYHSFYFGGGDAVVLNNGNSTATYYTGGDITLTTNFTAQVGLAITMFHWLGLNFDLYGLSLLSPTRRSFNGTVTLGINL